MGNVMNAFRRGGKGRGHGVWSAPYQAGQPSGPSHPLPQPQAHPHPVPAQPAPASVQPVEQRAMPAAPPMYAPPVQPPVAPQAYAPPPAPSPQAPPPVFYQPPLPPPPQRVAPLPPPELISPVLPPSAPQPNRTRIVEISTPVAPPEPAALPQPVAVVAPPAPVPPPAPVAPPPPPPMPAEALMIPRMPAPRPRQVVEAPVPPTPAPQPVAPAPRQLVAYNAPMPILEPEPQYVPQPVAYQPPPPQPSRAWLNEPVAAAPAPLPAPTYAAPAPVPVYTAPAPPMPEAPQPQTLVADIEPLQEPSRDKRRWRRKSRSLASVLSAFKALTSPEPQRSPTMNQPIVTQPILTQPAPKIVQQAIAPAPVMLQPQPQYQVPAQPAPQAYVAPAPAPLPPPQAYAPMPPVMPPSPQSPAQYYTTPPAAPEPPPAYTPVMPHTPYATPAPMTALPAVTDGIVIPSPHPTAGHYAPEIIVHHDRGSVVTEQYRAIRLQILARCRNRKLQTHVITSSAPNEGKTVTSINLAMAFAELQNQKTLLIEGDLRRPSFQDVIGQMLTPGLLHLLRGQMSDIRQAIHNSPYDNVQIMPAGDYGTTSSTELLSTPRFGQILDQLKHQYDHIIIDTPPVISVTDACIFGALADEVLLVVRLNGTPVEAVDRTKRLLRAANCEVAGVVLTHMKYHIPKYLYRYV